MYHGVRAVVVGLFALAGACALANATTPAGTVIRNQAEATYFDPAKDRSFEVLSTISTVRVTQAATFDLLNESTRLANPFQRVQFPHTLRNTGNVSDRYKLSVRQVDGLPFPDAIEIIHDVNENGVADAGEPLIERTPFIAPDQFLALIVAARVPGEAVPGTTFAVAIEAASDIEPDRVRTRTDTIEALAERQFGINKNAFPSCSVPVEAGSTIRYTLDMVNIDSLRSVVDVVSIDGETQRGLLIEDIVPANTELVLNDGAEPTPTGAIRLVRTASSADTWQPYASASSLSRPVAIALFVPEALLTPGQSSAFAFDVAVNTDITPGTVVTNRIHADLDGDGEADLVSNETCNTLTPGGAGANTAQLRFLEPSQTIRLVSLGVLPTQSSDVEGVALPAAPRHAFNADYRDAPVYRLDSFPGYTLSRDGVYLEVRSNSLNTDGAISEDRFDRRFIRVQVESRETGDTLQINLLETGPNTGLFRAEVPFRLSEVDTGQGRACNPMSVEACVLQSASGDRLEATIFDPGLGTILVDTAVVDPRGLVFDSTSLDPVAGAQVTIRNADGSPAINPDFGRPYLPQQTDGTGSYVIPRLQEGLYYVDVSPPDDFSFPSRVPSDVFAGRRNVDDRSYGRDGPDRSLDAGLFSAALDLGPPIIDVPIDPDLTLGQLDLEKSVDRRVIQFGDTVEYTLTVSNNANAVLLDAKIADMPAKGFRILEGTVRLDGDPFDIIRGTGRLVTFPIGRLEIGQTRTVTYRMQAGPETQAGNAINVAEADAVTGGGVPARSFRVRAAVDVSDEGLFSDRAYIIGSVWADADGDGVRDEDEIGLPGARIWLEDGTWVETDELGRYSLFGLRPGMRMARIDPETLVPGYVPSEHTARQTGGGKGRFVDLLAGELHRADFPLACLPNDPCAAGSDFQRIAAERAARLSPDAMLDQALAFEGLIGETVGQNRAQLREQPGPDGDVSNGRFRVSGTPVRAAQPAEATVGGSAIPEASGELGLPFVDAPNAVAPDPETAARELGRVDIEAGEWLWPLPDARTGIPYARDGRFFAAVRPGMQPTLYVDGIAQSSETLGAVIENRVVGAEVAAWYGIELMPGRRHIEVRATDPFGNVRVLAAMTVVRPGAAETLVIEVPDTRMAADGISAAELVIRALDKNGAPAQGRHYITVTAEQEGNESAAVFLGQDVQPDTPGHQVRLVDGAAVVRLQAPERAGTVDVLATDGGTLSQRADVKFDTVLRDLIAVGIVDLTAQGFDVSGDLEPADPDRFPETMDVGGRTAFFLKGRVRGDALLTMAYDSDSSRNDGLFRDIDPEAYYPIYGDASERGFEAQSRSKLYVRLDKGVHSAMFGDFRTDAFGGEALTRTRRALTGANAFTGGEDWILQGFAAEADATSRTERFRGRGLALDFVLPGAPLVTNSEVLTIETRFRDTPGLIASEQALARFVDYLVDDDTGRVTLKAPIPSFDEAGNPVFLRATYETRGEATGDLVVGVRFERQGASRRIYAGANFDESEQAVDHRASASVGIEQTLAAGRVFAEIGGMDTEDSVGVDALGGAVRFGAELAMFGGQVSLEAAQADTAYDNADAPILAGRREARADYTAGINLTTSVSLVASHSEDIESHRGRSILEGQVERRLGNWSVSAGPRFVSEDTSDTASNITSGVVRLGNSFNFGGRSGSSFAELETALDTEGSRVTVGADALVHQHARAYASHRFIDDLPEQTFVPGLTGSQANVTQGRTVLGLETGIVPTTDIYGEWRQAGSLDAATGEAAYGIRALWEVMQGISVSPQLEITEVFDAGEDGAAVQDAAALSVAVADRRSQRARRSLRVEARSSDASTYFAMRSGWAQRFTPMLSGAAKIDFARDNIMDAPDSERVRTTFGLARRPASASSTDLFALYQWNHEATGALQRDVHIVSGHGNRQVGPQWTFASRTAAKWEEGIGFSASAQLASARIIRVLSRRWDMEVRGGLRSVGWGESEETSLGAALAWKPHEDVRLALGYNAIGFDDRDLDPRGYSARGVFTQMSLAVDETWFGWLRPE